MEPVFCVTGRATALHHVCATARLPPVVQGAGFEHRAQQELTYGSAQRDLSRTMTKEAEDWATGRRRARQRARCTPLRRGAAGRARLGGARDDVTAVTAAAAGRRPRLPVPLR